MIFGVIFMTKKIFLKILFVCLLGIVLGFICPNYLGIINVNAKPVTDVSGSYGLIKCNYDKVNGLTSCGYVSSYSIVGDSTTYTMLDKGSTFVHDHLNYARLNVFSALYLFPNINYKNGSFYTLNFEFNQGSYVSTIVNTLTKDNLVVEAFNGTDFVSGGYTELNYSATYNDTTKSGTISITFKATTDTTSYRIRLQPGVALWTNTSMEYAQGVRVYLISANVEDNLSDALLNQITNQNETIINQNQQLIDGTNKTNDKLDDLKNNQNKTNDTLNNDNVDEANSKANDFFNNFSDTDHNGISGIVKAPLVAFNSMLSNTCSPLTATYQGKEISLPCGDEFWSKLSALKTFINLTYGGILCYLIAVKLFKLVNNLKNPNNDKVEVMNL